MENHTRFLIPDQNEESRFQTKTVQKPYPVVAAHTYTAYIGEYPRAWMALAGTDSPSFILDDPVKGQ